ncbi:hypothetical protein [Furfurilactobacillus entadae]|uniref:hypothetical protein n=1 Tax=Furfurilactobacillus entadae TaxID=2922307 RepID=UPI0035EF7F6C
MNQTSSKQAWQLGILVVVALGLGFVGGNLFTKHVQHPRVVTKTVTRKQIVHEPAKAQTSRDVTVPEATLTDRATKLVNAAYSYSTNSYADRPKAVGQYGNQVVVTAFTGPADQRKQNAKVQQTTSINSTVQDVHVYQGAKDANGNLTAKVFTTYTVTSSQFDNGERKATSVYDLTFNVKQQKFTQAKFNGSLAK